MRDAERLGDAAGIVDVLAGAARAGAMRRRAMIVELQRDADDVIALALQQAGDDGGIDAARHRDDDAGVFGPSGKIRLFIGLLFRIVHGALSRPAEYRSGRARSPAAADCGGRSAGTVQMPRKH